MFNICIQLFCVSFPHWTIKAKATVLLRFLLCCCCYTSCTSRLWSSRGSALYVHNVLAESRFAIAIHMMSGDWQQLQSTHFWLQRCCVVCKSCMKTSKKTTWTAFMLWTRLYQLYQHSGQNLFERIHFHTEQVANWHLHHQPLWCTCCGIYQNAHQCSPFSALYCYYLQYMFQEAWTEHLLQALESTQMQPCISHPLEFLCGWSNCTIKCRRLIYDISK